MLPDDSIIPDLHTSRVPGCSGRCHGTVPIKFLGKYLPSLTAGVVHELQVWDCRRLEKDVSFRSRITYAAQGARRWLLVVVNPRNKHIHASGCWSACLLCLERCLAKLSLLCMGRFCHTGARQSYLTAQCQ